MISIPTARESLFEELYTSLEHMLTQVITGHKLAVVPRVQRSYLHKTEHYEKLYYYIILGRKLKFCQKPYSNQKIRKERKVVKQGQWHPFHIIPVLTIFLFFFKFYHQKLLTF